VNALLILVGLIRFSAHQLLLLSQFSAKADCGLLSEITTGAKEFDPAA